MHSQYARIYNLNLKVNNLKNFLESIVNILGFWYNRYDNTFEVNS